MLSALLADELREDGSLVASVQPVCVCWRCWPLRGVPVQKESALLPERHPFTSDVIRGVICDLGEEDFEQLRMNACNLLSCGQLRFSEMLAGTDFSWDLFMEFLYIASGGVEPIDKWVHGMEAEHNGWKRSFIRANNPNQVRLFGDAGGLQLGRAHCFVKCREVRVPRRAVLAAGFN